MEPEGRALTLDAVEADASTMSLHDLARKNETSPRSRDSELSADVAAEELREDPVLMFRRNPEAFVAHPDPCLVTDEGRTDVDVRRAGRVLDRVREHVPDHLCEPIAITVDDELLVGRLKMQRVPLALRRVERGLAREQLVEIDVLQSELQGLLLDTLEVE